MRNAVWTWPGTNQVSRSRVNSLLLLPRWGPTLYVFIVGWTYDFGSEWHFIIIINVIITVMMYYK